jgi:hypothetical protein
LDTFLGNSTSDSLMDLCEIKDKEKDQRLHQSFGPELPLKHGVTINRNWERV